MASDAFPKRPLVISAGLGPDNLPDQGILQYSAATTFLLQLTSQEMTAPD
jgi:hypothetical protein